MSTTTGTVTVKKGPPCESDEHCWHRATFQHAMMHHVDETCCHCGEDRCRSTFPEYEAYRAQHGPYLP